MTLLCSCICSRARPSLPSSSWNQFGDDLRGVDAVSVIGNAGPSQQSDGGNPESETKNKSLTSTLLGADPLHPYLASRGVDEQALGHYGGDRGDTEDPDVEAGGGVC